MDERYHRSYIRGAFIGDDSCRYETDDPLFAYVSLFDVGRLYNEVEQLIKK